MRHTLRMLVAGTLIQRELRNTPACERYAQVIAGPREFWTLTIWQDAPQMRACMRGGAHGRTMWRQPQWLECYWGMRWRPDGHGSGTWPGRSVLRWPDRYVAPQPAARPNPMPLWMQAALGNTVRLEQRQVAGAACATYRLRVPPWTIPSAVRALGQLRRTAFADRESFRLSLGIGTGWALYLLVVATSADALDRARARPEHERFLQRWGDRAWCSTWQPESEFGHWQSHKFRDGQLTRQPLVIDEKLSTKPIAAREARDILRARLESVDPASLEVLQVLTSELVSNSVKHAGLTAADWTGLQVRANHEWIRVEVIDRGRRFEPLIPLSKSFDDESGWGLFILNERADRWGIIDHTDDRRIWFELRVPVRNNLGRGSAERGRGPNLARPE